MEQMNRCSALLVLIGLLSLLTGCMPLQQAPLVYASKVSVGIDISGTTTEQPGISAAVGVKMIDAAYVPVAVAKPCDTNERGQLTHCTNDIYKLANITGTNVVDDSRIPKDILDKAKGNVEAVKKVIKEKDEASNAVDKAYNDRKKAVEAKTTAEDNLKIIDQTLKVIAAEQGTAEVKRQAKDAPLKDAKKKHQAAEDELTKKPGDLTLKQAEETAKEQESIAQADYDSALKDKTNADDKYLQANIKKIQYERDLEEAKYKIETSKKAIEIEKLRKNMADEKYSNLDTSGLLADLELLGKANTKHDAYSVFGTFNADTQTSVTAGGTAPAKAEIPLVIGKVFSTGVASQNLTEGMKAYYMGKGDAHCLIVGQELIAEYEKKLGTPLNADKNAALVAFMTSIAKACETQKKKAKE